MNFGKRKVKRFFPGRRELLAWVVQLSLVALQLPGRAGQEKSVPGAEPRGAALAEGDAPAGPPEAKAASGEPEGEEPALSLEDPEARVLIEELRQAYPTRDTARRHRDDLRDRLGLWLADHLDSPSAGEIRALLAEVELLVGPRKGQAAARSAWGELARLGPRGEDRARGLFLLGEDYFRGSFGIEEAEARSTGAARARLRKRLESYRAAARRYFGVLLEEHPDARGAIAARSALRYLDIAGGRVVPPFEGRLEIEGTERPFTPETFRGRVVLLDFWRTRSARAREREADLQRSLERYLEKYPELRPSARLIGVNLDRDRGAFEAAVRAWGISAPQVHDGKGLGSSLARAFAIPCVPHFAVVDEKGALAYLGVSREAFFREAETALKRVRAALSRDGREPGASGS